MSNAISSYGDGQALEDGFLVDIASMRVSYRNRPVTRMTRNLWTQLEAGTMNAEGYPGVKFPGVRAQIATILRTKIRYATDENGDGRLVNAVGVWLVWNGDGYTAMMPEDY